jgi:hypothetical protein
VKASKAKRSTSAKRSGLQTAKRATSATSATRPKAKAAKRVTSAGGRAGHRTMKYTKARKDKRPEPVAVVRVAVRELDPQKKCGAGTSVQFLYRVDESVDGRASAHLVFFDRHGWYCEHGRSCPAIAHARKYNGKHPGQIARVS